MYHFLHCLVCGELMASYSIFGVGVGGGGSGSEEEGKMVGQRREVWAVWRMLQNLKLQLLNSFNWVWVSMVMQQLHLQTAIFSFRCKLPASVSHAASHSNELCLLLNPLHITFEYLSMLVQNNCKHYSSYCRLCPEHPDKWCGMFPFHFAHWLKVVDQWFVPSSDVFKEGLTLLTTVIPRNWQISILHYAMFFCQVFWNM